MIFVEETDILKIVKLEKEHLIEAGQLALDNYREECSKVNTLPEVTKLPELECFVQNEFGVAAFEGDTMVGFLGCYNPWDGAFDYNVKGTFTPIHAHGCVKENRAWIYGMMYQQMAKLLVEQGVLYHGIALYAHDADAISAYFHNGFGHRCSDAIRRMELIQDIMPTKGISFAELPASEIKQVRELRRKLSRHMGESSCFMYTTDKEFAEWIVKRENNSSRIFMANDKELPIAFVEICDEAETFVTELPSVKNICGAFCMPEYRGRQIYQNLINYTIEVLQKEGYQYLGVDYESFNPTARHFWPKYFEPYTCSVTRRIDEGVLRK